MITEMCSNLANLDNKVFAKYAYDKEPLRGKLSFDDYYNNYYLIAQEEGKKVANDFKGKSVDDLILELDGKVTFQEMQGGEQIYNFAMFTEPNEIIVYKQNAEESQEIVDAVDDERYKGIKIKDTILAHEAFHMLESRYKDLFIYKPHIKLWKFFKYENISKLVSLEEVAAMSFAKELLDMRINPYCLDVVMCMSRAPERAKKLYNYYMDKKEELSNE